MSRPGPDNTRIGRADGPTKGNPHRRPQREQVRMDVADQRTFPCARSTRANRARGVVSRWTCAASPSGRDGLGVWHDEAEALGEPLAVLRDEDHRLVRAVREHRWAGLQPGELHETVGQGLVVPRGGQHPVPRHDGARVARPAGRVAGGGHDADRMSSIASDRTTSMTREPSTRAMGRQPVLLTRNVTAPPPRSRRQGHPSRPSPVHSRIRTSGVRHKKARRAFRPAQPWCSA